jgi:hypothetical protein
MWAEKHPICFVWYMSYLKFELVQLYYISCFATRSCYLGLTEQKKQGIKSSREGVLAADPLNPLVD